MFTVIMYKYNLSLLKSSIIIQVTYLYLGVCGDLAQSSLWAETESRRHITGRKSVSVSPDVMPSNTSIHRDMYTVV